ncbi:phosphotransferase family protein [Streptomyces sp. S1]|uniref:phosphotransferase family protein n=1 Tax=Streptomyces sp. S1 TaxID=718288 RepID=UPI000EF7636F|nr:aminoglycoside phosphotransferase family protein [Streptomyces sp. S1]
MTITPAPGGFDDFEMHQVLERACEKAGLDSRDARLLRGHTNAVLLLEKEQVVAKIARKGTDVDSVIRTVSFVRWLIEADFPTVPLHPCDQPLIIDGHAVTFWTYLPQPESPVPAWQLAGPLKALHTLPRPPIALAEHNNIRAIRRSLSAITCLPVARVRYLEHEADRLEEALEGVPFALDPGLIQGDPQHRNALHTADGTAVLCDWDTIAQGQPEWDLVTVEVHCRRFGYGEAHYQAFVDAYGLDIRENAGYSVLRDIRELRMVTTNARKVRHAPESLSEIQRRVDGLRRRDEQLRWSIL